MENLQPANVAEIGALIADTYRVEDKLGEGGMGVVVKAVKIATNERVAIKLIRPEVASEEALSRFEREARAASTLTSENVCRASEVGTTKDGHPYMVMEYLDGEDLGKLLERRGRLPIHEAVDIVLQICSAMNEAHAKGIIHRDLKPKNLYIARRPDGRPLVKILDFGISKIADKQDMQLTRTTEIIGSPSYMSPEQLRASRDVDHRTDIWALGVILFELLTNEIPFQAEVVTQLVAVVLMEPHPSVRSFRPEVPAGIDAIISRCLAKKTDDRYQGVSELAYALEAFKDPVPNDIPSFRSNFGETALMLPAPVSSRVHVHGGTSVAWGETQIDMPPRRPARWPALVAALGALLVVGGAATSGAVWYARRADAAPPPAAVAGPGAGSDFVPLPPSRKDLPPLDPAPNAPPPTEAKLDAPIVDTTAPEAPVKAPRIPTTRPQPKASGDPLSHIGRR